MDSTQDLQAIADLFLTFYPRYRRLVMEQFSQTAADDLTLSQIRALGKLANGPITLSELAERLTMTRQGASLQAQALVEQGWVSRTPDPADRRSALLEATAEGKARWLESRGALVSSIAAQLGQLSPDEIAALSTALGGLMRVTEQAGDRVEA